MTDDIWQRAEIESPCVKLCVLHPEARICVGCYRTGEEIGGWSQMSADERRAIMDELPARGSTLTQRSGGRSSRLKRRRGSTAG